MNKITLCFVVLIALTLNSASASNENITKNDFNNLVNSNELEHSVIQKELTDIIEKNKMSTDNISKKLDNVSSGLIKLSTNFEKESSIAATVTIQIALFTIIVAVVLSIITLIIPAVQALPSKKDSRFFNRTLQVSIIFFIMGTLFGYLPGAITSANLPKPFAIFTPHADWLGWVIGIAGVIIALLGYRKRNDGLRELEDRKDDLIIGALKKYKHYIQLCNVELTRLRNVVNDDIKIGGNGSSIFKAELQNQTNKYSEWISNLDKETIFIRSYAEYRFNDTLNNGIKSFRTITDIKELTNYSTTASLVAKVDESITIINGVKNTIETELENNSLQN